MPRRKKNSHRRKRSRRPARPVLSDCVALIPVDGTGIRKKAATALKRARTAYGKAEEEWVFFETEEQPAFGTWLRLQCGALYSRLQILGEELSSQEFLLRQIQYEQAKTGDSPKICYERVMDRKEHPEKYEDDEQEEDPWEERDEEADDFDPWGDESDWEDDAGPFDDSFDRNRDAGERGPGVKSLFRELCRRLHPDVAGSMSSAEKELWHQVQHAYQAGDEARLELLLSHCDAVEGRKPKQSTVWNMVVLTRQIRRALRTLRRAIRDARQEPSWGFLSWDAKSKDKFLKRARKELKEDIADLEEEVEFYREQVESWKNARRDHAPFGLMSLFEDFTEEVDFEAASTRSRSSSRRKKSRRDAQEEFEFF
jgi:hypothetical protein